MKQTALVLLTSFIVCLPVLTFSQKHWEIAKRQDGIVVYTKEEKTSEFKAFKGVVTVEASTNEIVSVLKDANQYVEWYGYTRTSKLLKREAEIQYTYVETVFPWPYSNRDMVYRMSIEELESGTVKVSLNGVPNYLPEKKEIVRMKEAKGYILLRPIDANTEITYVFHSEPGNIPVWLANNSIAELPYKTLLGLRQLLHEGNFRE
ncbi:MAG: START domain-containing protein [Cyclobacteriaceae bacterium]